MNRHLMATTVALTLALADASAFAQAPAPADTPQAPSLHTSEMLPKQATDDRSSGGPLASVGQALADDGITFRSKLDDEYARNVTGGANQGSTNVGQIFVGADVDFDRLVGWSGASLHVTGYRDYGVGMSKHVTGTFFKQQGIYKNEYPEYHLGLVSLEQKLLDGDLDLLVGRLGTTNLYGQLDTNCYFQSGATCGVPTVLNSESGFGLLPSATWGGNVKYYFTKEVYAQAGAFEVNPTVAPSNGTNWTTDGATGVTVPFEIGYQDANFNKTQYPTEIKIGYYASTPPLTDLYYNAKGTSAVLAGGKLVASTDLRSGVYLMGDRVLWRPDAGSNMSLAVFGGIAQPLEEEEVIDRQVYGGLLLRDPFGRGTRGDTIGFEVSWFHVSPREMEALRDNRLKLHGGGIENPNEVNFELNYGWAITKSIRLTPNIQYTANPESANLPKISFVPRNMIVYGVKLNIDFADLLGLPSRAAD